MSTIYRTVFTDDRSDLMIGARDLFSSWLVGKGIEIELPNAGTVEVAAGLAVEVIGVEDTTVEAVRFRLDEERAGQRWSTILTAMAAEGVGWVWIDLERVSDDAYGPPPLLAPPRLVRSFLESSICRAGSTILRPTYRLIDENGVDQLVDELLDPGRIVPVLVASRDVANPSGAGARARELASALLGVANVWALDGTATSALSIELGQDLHVFGGAVRTYFPGLTIYDPYPRRHRFARRELFVPYPRKGAQVVARAIIGKAATARPPILFRNRVAMLPGFSRQGHDAEQLLTELVAAEEDRDGLREDLEWAILEAEDSAAQAEAARSRVRWLEQRLSSVGEYVAGVATPADEVPALASGSVEALDFANTHLGLVHIGDTVESAGELDQHLKAGTWGRKAWQGLRALQSYAEAKALGNWTGGFQKFCAAALPGSEVIPAEWVAAGESETTTNNPRFRQARIFSVPTEVCADGRAFMEEHIKLEKGSDPAPRIHFWDDTAGKTGKVYVGYLGRHLPSFQTN